jgi:hypothetical protein
MGCGETLFRDSDGAIVCESKDCPDATAATKVLSDQETEHIVTIGYDAWNMQHPLRERIDQQLLECELAAALMAEGPPLTIEQGRYRVHKAGHDPVSQSFRSGALAAWVFTRIPAPDGQQPPHDAKEDAR